MKIMHLPFCFYPDVVGGTEVYVELLARYLRAAGHEAVIVAPGRANSRYDHNGLTVYRYALSEGTCAIEELYGEGDIAAAGEFANILERERPDIVHMHAFTRGVSLRCARAAKKAGIPVVVTYHTPTVSCQRGTLMRWGRTVCDGRLTVTRCTACTLHGLGVPQALAALLALVPAGVGDFLGALNLAGGWRTAVRMRALMYRRKAAFRDFMKEADRVVVLCRWSADLLARNGLPETKMTLIRQG
ncbi:MAG: glycosyltransferase, partial [Candidatus Omnitrophota bacterium]